ncbi:SDR family oxidoreductase [uncultured Sneathiella sp.]|jgi:NAD(P)-dependent dehydrogenase (short-subunit alcohol dehydrogenase family)|uniref:SDR family NAD(P)-dependent oxidoreductase n=1 Tax=uncultured Sneathiella sp. TaxID=879315 RepID=UPI0030DA0720|tara:strand:+ start:675 stop:1412 length:738 start_codon:yes stop_codon:yes gene_type:complete
MADTQKVLLLTGASRGIGHATVKRFSAAGWRVLTVSRHAFSEYCPWEGGEKDHLQIDLADIEALPKSIEHIREKLDGAPLHALVNNAGVSPKGPEGARFNTLNSVYADWLHVYNVNLFAPLMLAQGLFDELVAAKGAIVNVTSIAGGHVHPFAGSAYGTSKAALSALTRELASDFGPHGVRVNAIAPGEIDTSILSPGTEDMIKDIPLRRLGKPEEVASTIYFLCDAPSSYVTGAEVHINGGQHV